MSAFYKICLCLVILGGLNWGLVGIFHFDLINWLCGGFNWVGRVLYILVGVAALCCIPLLGKECKGEG